MMKHLRVAFTYWLILTAMSRFASPIFAQNRQSLSPEADSAHPSSAEAVREVSLEQAQPDGAIQSRLTEILLATEWFDDVRVDVRHGVAFLHGTAQDLDHVEWAEDLARRTDGVAAVVSRVQVKKKTDLAKTLQVVVSSVKSLWDDFLAQSPLVAAGFLAIVLTALVSKIVQAIATRTTRRSKLRSSVQDLILHLLTIGVWTAGLLVAAVITFPGMTPARALTVLGLGSVAIGFAFKDIFENFFAGILILWKYPFDKGDFIECGEIKGRIEDITIRMTMIRQVDGQLVVVPNAMLFKNAVDVLTSRRTRRTTVICGVTYDVDLGKARDVIHKAVESCETVRNAEGVEIFAREFADSSINFEVTWWTGATPKDIRQSRDEVVRSVKRALDEAGIEIPFPQRTLWLPKPITTQAVEALSSNGRGANASDHLSEKSESLAST